MFFWKTSTYYHIATKHSDSDLPKVICEICDYTARNNAILKRHIEVVHLKEKNEECEFCNEKFASLQVLNNHIKAFHFSEIKEEKCDQCDYSRVSNKRHDQISVTRCTKP